MRILSQDGMDECTIDVPYERVSIERRGHEIWCGYSFTLSRHCTGKRFAVYSSKIKAKKAMEMLHDAYASEGKYFQFPENSEVEVTSNE